MNYDLRERKTKRSYKDPSTSGSEGQEIDFGIQQVMTMECGSKSVSLDSWRNPLQHHDYCPKPIQVHTNYSFELKTSIHSSNSISGRFITGKYCRSREYCELLSFFAARHGSYSKSKGKSNV